MAAVSGITYLLKANTGPDGAPVYTTVAGQRDLTLTLTQDKINVTNKDSGSWEESVPGTRHWTFADTLVIIDEAGGAIAAVRNAYFNHAQLRFQGVSPGGKTYTGKANVDNIGITGGHESEFMMSFSISGTAALVEA